MGTTPPLPTLSVVVRSRNEADRLRLTLTALARQKPFEVIVVDDCSDDHTQDVLTQASKWLPLASLRNGRCLGRSAASNAGARAARGDVVLFLDGDTLAGPDCLERHAGAHAAAPNLVGRGEVLHLRCTRFLLDPESGTARPGEEARMARMPAAEVERLKVTREQVLQQFDAIDARAEYGIYPGAGPRRLYELEVQAVRERPDCTVLWAAAVGCNLSVRREAFLAAGGFDEALDNNEHRELVLRLLQRSHRVGIVEGARTYHMTHRSGWRDPLVDSAWERVFYARHPLPAVKMLSVFWAGLSDGNRIPVTSRIPTLPELEARSRDMSDAQIDALRSLVGGLPDLSRVTRGVP